MINNLANEMSKTEDVAVCSIYEPQENDHLWFSLGPNVKRISLGKKANGGSFKYIWKIYKLIKDRKYDIVQTHGFFIYYILSVLLLHRKVKFFYTVHSDAAKENNRWDRRIMFFKRNAFKYGFIHPITISLHSRESFTQLYRTQSKLIPNGINPNDSINKTSSLVDKYKINPESRILLHIGRIDTPKNQLALCEAVTNVIKEGEDVVLLIAGPIANKDIFSGMRKYFSDRIVYIGEISNPIDFLYYSDAMLLPSIWEGLPVTLLESMSVGCIPICSPVGGIPNVIRDNKTGFLSASPNVPDFTETLLRFLRTPIEKIEAMKESIIAEFVSKYTIEITAKNYLDYYIKTK